MGPSPENPLKAPTSTAPQPDRHASSASRWLQASLAALALVGAGSACSPARVEMAVLENRCSLRLDGRDDYVDLGRVASGHPLLLAGSRFTVAAWFRQEPGGDPYERIIDKSDGALALNGWALAVDPIERRIHFYVNDGRRGGDFIGRAGAFRPERWHLVTAVARVTHLEIYLDGRRERSAAYESGSFTLPGAQSAGARLGAWNHEPGRTFRGWIDEVAVWKTDLPPVAIGALAAARGRADLQVDREAYGASGDLVAWWRMESGSEPGAAVEIREQVSGLRAPLMPDAAGGNAPRIDCETVP